MHFQISVTQRLQQHQQRQNRPGFSKINQKLAQVKIIRLIKKRLKKVSPSQKQQEKR